MPFEPEVKRGFGYAFRMFAIEAAFLGAAWACIVVDLVVSRNTNEHGIVEMAQLALVEFSTFAFYVNARANKALRIPLVLLGTMMFAAFFRETDGMLDMLVFHGFWKFVSIPAIIVALAYALRNFREAARQCAAFARTHAFHYVLLGLLVTGAFAQAISYKGMWSGFPDGIRMRSIKNIIQESFELLGYSIIAFGAIAIDAERPGKMARTERDAGRDGLVAK